MKWKGSRKHKKSRRHSLKCSKSRLTPKNAKNSLRPETRRKSSKVTVRASVVAQSAANQAIQADLPTVNATIAPTATRAAPLHLQTHLHTLNLAQSRSPCKSTKKLLR